MYFDTDTFRTTLVLRSTRGPGGRFLGVVFPFGLFDQILQTSCGRDRGPLVVKEEYTSVERPLIVQDRQTTPIRWKW